ncbi:MAG TPA: hypothetical protein VNZ64_13235 [Candidatus Acidoferrum sp.]|jgi:hypothetical protein|nr:hypothetical protein [Candidatus Acidoferrum sp.]
MVTKICSRAVNGIQAYPLEKTGCGNTSFVILVRPDAAVKEFRDRLMTSFISSGFAFTLGLPTLATEVVLRCIHAIPSDLFGLCPPTAELSAHNL